ncbi:MAG: thioesterase family protein [Coxiellaceae bacterium]|nr:thioesterase family protein [Coxiellaceae bacterium]
MEQVEIPVRWVDIDSYQHVNNAKYFDYMTEARALCLINLNTDPNIQFILADTSCRFKQPINFPSTVIIQQSISNIGHSSFQISYQFYTSDSPDKLRATGTARMVCFDAKNKTSCNIPQNIINYLQQHLEETD